MDNNSIQDLRAERAVIATEIKALLDGAGKDKWNDTLQASYDEGLSKIDAIDAQIKRISDFHERMASDNVQSQVTEAANRFERDSGSDSGKIFAKWLRKGDNALSAEEWGKIRATMSTTTDSEGGYTVPKEIASTVAEALKTFGGMRDVATVIQTDTGNPFNFPTSDGTAETGEIVAENAAASSADIAFGSVALNTYKYSSKVVAVPVELLQDSSVDIEAFIRNRLVQRVARISNTHFTIGTGTGQPRGVVTAAAAGKVGATGQIATVIYDDVVDLIHSIDPVYRSLNHCRFMMNDASLKVIRKLKDTQGRPIYLPGCDGLAAAMPDSILGYPITINQDVATMAANAKSILFGDFGFYTIRDALVNSFFRFTDSAYAKNGQVGFLMFARCGGNYTDAGGGVKYYQNSAT